MRVIGGRGLVALMLSFCVSAQDVHEALAQRAVDAERRGDFSQAVTLFQQLIHEGADSPELRSNLGIAYYQSGDLHSALRQFRAALVKAPDFPPANLFCGLSLAKLQQPKEALPYLLKASRSQATDATTLLALAQAQVASNQIPAANETFRRLTSLDARNAEAWYGLGITDRLLAEAKSKTAKQNTNTVEATNELHQAQELMSDFQRSVGVAMGLNPGSVRANMILGESFRIAERFDEAIREYEAATSQAPNLAAAWAGLAAAYSAAGDDAKALTAATRALNLDPNDPETNTLIAAIHVRMGDLQKAEPFVRNALGQKPDLSSAHVVLAKIYLSRREPDRAVSELQAAVKDDTDGSTNYLLATTLRRLGRTTEAASAMRKFEQLHRSRLSSAAE